MNNQISLLTTKQRQILKILTNKRLYEKPILDQHIFNTDLVIKMRFPFDKKIMNKSQYIPLNQFIYNPSQDLNTAYSVAYQNLTQQTVNDFKFQQGQLNIQSTQSIENIKIKNQINFEQVDQQKDVIQNKYKVLLGNGKNTLINFPCYVNCKSSQVDAFTLNYNSLIYVLQQKCGFQTYSVILQQKQKSYVYILLTQNSINLLKSADKYRIKKQVDYSQLDLFLNQPVDSLGRPYQNNQKINTNTKLQLQILNLIDQKIKKLNEKKLKQQVQEYQIVLTKSKRQKYEIKQKNHGKTAAIIQPIYDLTNKNVKKEQRINKPQLEKDNKNRKKQTTRNPVPQQIQEQQRSNFHTKDSQEKRKLSLRLKQNELKQLFKRVHRNLNNKSYKITQQIIDQKRLSQWQIKFIKDYMSDFFSKFDYILKQQIYLTSQQKNYLYKINRKKINSKVEKQYIQKLKRQKLYRLIQQLAQQYHLEKHKKPISFFPFILPSRKLSFVQRLRGILLYQEYTVNQYGDLSLFSKMDRIKIAYLTLKQYVRVDNISKINCSIFALHDDFQRFGYRGQAVTDRKIIKQIKGGINGHNLVDNWNPFTPWKTNITVLRNYFGEDTVYQIYIKNHLVLYFMIIAPLGGLGQAISRLFVYYNTHYTGYMQRGFSATHKQQLIFHISYFAIAISIFAYFFQRWIIKEKQFKDNFMENQSGLTFRYQYEGPYVRNLVTDQPNEHKISLDLKSLGMKFLSILLILIILGGECGYFHGMRMAIIQLAITLPRTNFYLISWPHVICYGIFLISNIIIFQFIIVYLSRKLTEFQNLPTLKMHNQSIQRKRFLFLIGVQMIPVIFLLVFQPFGGTSCYSSSCYDEFTQYIYSRFCIVFLHIAYKFASFIITYIRLGIKKKNSNNDQVVDFDVKMTNYLDFILKQSKKPVYQASIQDQTSALLHYGMFVTSFPLCPVLSLCAIILEYLIQRIQLILYNKRPICKSQSMQNYSDNYQFIMHLSIFINCWIIFYTLQQVEYSFQRLIRIFDSSTPTYDGILILKILIVVISIVIFEILVLIVRYFAKSSQTRILNNRKKNKYEKYLIEKNIKAKNKSHFEFDRIHPFRTIFRTYHPQNIQKKTKSNKFIEEFDEQIDGEYSAQLLKRKRY